MCAALDRLLTFDPGERGVDKLDAAGDGGSRVVAAATTLRDAVADGECVILTTGFPIPPAGRPETDGPPGTMVLARALRAMGAAPVIVAEPALSEPLAAAADVLGCPAVPFEPISPAATSAAAKRVLTRCEPTAVIAIERPSRTADGSYRSMTGTEITDHVAPVDALFTAAQARGIPTIGVGDGGNEIGMGRVRSTVEAEIDHGDRIAATTAVDQLVVAGVSNWGAYGIVAALATRTESAALHDPATERALLAACCEAGCVDGRAGVAAPRVDGLDAELHAHLVGLLNGVVDHTTTKETS
jgi:hypothetical protein